jgi:hypothetical protein
MYDIPPKTYGIQVAASSTDGGPCLLESQT